MNDETGSHHYESRPLPSEPQWRVPVEPTAGYRDGEFRARARTAEKAARRAKTLHGLAVTDEPERIDTIREE